MTKRMGITAEAIGKDAQPRLVSSSQKSSGLSGGEGIQRGARSRALRSSKTAAYLYPASPVLVKEEGSSEIQTCACPVARFRRNPEKPARFQRMILIHRLFFSYLAFPRV